MFLITNPLRKEEINLLTANIDKVVSQLQTIDSLINQYEEGVMIKENKKRLDILNQKMALLKSEETKQIISGVFKEIRTDSLMSIYTLQVQLMKSDLV